MIMVAVCGYIVCLWLFLDGWWFVGWCVFVGFAGSDSDCCRLGGFGLDLVLLC